MSGLDYHKLFIHDHLNSRELSEVYFSESTNRGRLFIILELPKNKFNQQPIIDQIIRQTANQFGSGELKDPELALEEILQNLNQILPELTPIKIHNWLNNLDLVLGIIDKNSVYMASIGKAEGLLIHHNKLTPILEKTTKINPVKIFSDIISGELEEGDVLVISTNALFDYISQEKIKQLVKKYTPRAVVAELQKLLSTVPNFVNFNSIIVKKPGKNDLDMAPDGKINVAVSSEEDEMEAKVDVVTTKSTKVASTIPRSPRPKVKTKLVVDFENLQKVKLIYWLKRIFLSAKLFFNIVGKVFKKFFRYLKNAFSFLTSRHYRTGHEDNWLDKILQFIENRLSWFGKLAWQKKILLIGLFIVVLVFLQSLVFLTQEKSLVKKDNTYYATIQEINQALNEVQASLIYDDEKRAEELLLAIQIMLADLEPNSQEQSEEIAEAQEKTARVLNEVRHINYVPAPLELFDLTTTLTEPRQIVQKDDNFYILDKDQLYLFTNEAITALAEFPGGTGMANWPEENKLILSNNENYIIFDTKTKTQETFSFNQSAGNTKVQDTIIYAGNLYVLDSINNQIFKYPGRGQSFSNAQTWLEEEVDLSKANSFTVDGDIYIIDNAGKISKFNKGKKEIFAYHQPHPPLGSGTIIKTFADSNYLYIIDPDNQRIVILDKDGNIKDQYSSTKFDNLIDLAVNIEETAIYLLNGQHVYLLAINE